jgi:membrane carboxypeptidase/penicillin-binding protein
MDVWFVGYTSRWMTTTWIGDDKRQRPLGHKDAAFMLTVPMFARYMTEVTAGQKLQEIPWDRPAGVKPGDTGGTLRTTMEEVKDDLAVDQEATALPAVLEPTAMSSVAPPSMSAPRP